MQRRYPMDDMPSSNEAAVDYSLLEKVNPVFLTAKMTLFQLAANGDPDAAALAESMGLTLEETQNSANTTTTPEQVLGGTIMLEARYRTMASLAESSGYTLVDLPCGYTPRAITFAKKGLPYYGLDLPVVIREISSQVNAMVSPEEREFIHYKEVDATNYASLEKAVSDIDGEVCINTEGLLMYFTDSEAGALCNNIRRILKMKGGCWYVADPESSLQYIATMRALVGDRFLQIMQNAKQQTKDKSDVEIGKNSLMASPADIEGTTKRAMAFLAEHGLKRERVIVAEHLPELDSLSKISPEQANAIREGMSSCAYWKVTLDETAPTVELPSSEAKNFTLNGAIQNGTLSLNLSGRLDTISAPTLLTFFEKVEKEHSVESVLVDCSNLEYVSSAGLRVLAIMRRACAGGVTLANSNEFVADVIEQTGFGAVLTIV
ncbi:MAG: STAS domain-containing protein [Coriobacteriaceae bacterium]|nr:STAS domain-containing protein [Coriobacteriaceae bacterium]